MYQTILTIESNPEDVKGVSPSLGSSIPQGRLDDKDTIVVQKCSCKSAWCEDCMKPFTAPKIEHYLNQMDWQSVRLVTLTVDPKLYGPEEAWTEVAEGKVISNMIRDFKRRENIEIKRWLWVLERHRNDYPHWHMFIETKRGRAGMIGKATIDKRWPYGTCNWEKPVRDIKHWHRLSGYFGNTGYFEDGKGKGHQLQIFDWAADYTKTVRKFGRSKEFEPFDKAPKTKKEEKPPFVVPDAIYDAMTDELKAELQAVSETQAQEIKALKKKEEEQEQEEEDEKPKKPIRVRLGECGSAVMIHEMTTMGFYRIYRMAVISWQDFMADKKKKFVEGLGYEIELTVREILGLCYGYNSKLIWEDEEGRAAL